MVFGNNMLTLLKLFFLRLFRRKAPQRKYYIGNVKRHNSHIDTLSPQLIKIGDNFISAPGSMVLSHDASTFYHTGKYKLSPTTLGDNVFLGANSIVLPGVTVGDNVIVGAGSVVTKDVENSVVVAGNPAKVICTLEEYTSKFLAGDEVFTPPSSFSNAFTCNGVSSDDIAYFQELLLRDDRFNKNIS